MLRAYSEARASLTARLAYIRGKIIYDTRTRHTPLSNREAGAEEMTGRRRLFRGKVMIFCFFLFFLQILFGREKTAEKLFRREGNFAANIFIWGNIGYRCNLVRIFRAEWLFIAKILFFKLGENVFSPFPLLLLQTFSLSFSDCWGQGCTVYIVTKNIYTHISIYTRNKLIYCKIYISARCNLSRDRYNNMK